MASGSAAGALIGLLFVAISVASERLARAKAGGTLGDALFLTGLAGTLMVQLIEAVDGITQPGDFGAVNTIAVLVIVCFLIGIARSWELIGGPSIGIGQEVRALARAHKRGADGPADEERP